MVKVSPNVRPCRQERIGLDLADKPPFRHDAVALADDGGRDVWIPRKGEPSPVGISEQVGAGGGFGGGAWDWLAGGLVGCGHGLDSFVIGLVCGWLAWSFRAGGVMSCRAPIKGGAT